jgi:hypothetical protein
VTTRLTATGDGGTTIEMASHVDVTGRVAQFGRGIMQDVANRLIKDFANCLEAQLTGQQAAAAVAASDASGTPATPQAEAATESRTAGTGAAQNSQQTSPVPSQPTPIRPLPLLADVARSRTAWVLRKIADRIEPR